MACFAACLIARKREGDHVESIVKPQIMRVMLSTALYWAWIFLLYWSSTLLGPIETLFYGKGAAFFGSAMALLAWFLIVRSGRSQWAERPLSRYAPYVLTPLAGLGSLANALVAPLPLFAVVALWFLSGYGAAFVLTRMARAFNQLGKESSFVVIFVALFIGCLIAVFTSALPSGSAASSVIMAVLPLAAFAFAPDARSVREIVSSEDLAAGNRSGEGAEEPGLPQVSREGRYRFVTGWVQLFFYSVAFSFSLCAALGNDGSNMPSMFVWFGVFLAGLLIMVYGMWLNSRLSIDLVQFILLGITVVGLAPLTLADQVPDAMLYGSCVLLMFGFTSYDMISLSQLLSVIAAEGMPFYRYFSLGRVANALGVFVGWVLAVALFAAVEVVQDKVVAQMLPLALIVALVVIIMACSYGRRAGGVAVRGEAASIDPQGAWKRSCDELCAEYGLSARECEVFALCAKGRDSAYICNALYISSHTVKSHIYHIYGKMGIHSQQELISMVEERADSLKAGRI